MKTTKIDFEKFQNYCEHWKQKLGLLGWVVFYEHKHVEGAYAQTKWRTSDHAATIQFCTNWDELRPKNDIELERLAVHEVSHVLLAPLSAEAEWRYTSEDAIKMAEHAIVRTLENILIEQKYAKV